MNAHEHSEAPALTAREKRAAQIQTACEQLLALGEPPTCERVRQLLGRGSMTTISEHVRNFRQKLEQDAVALSPEALAIVQNAARQLQRQIVADADRRWASDRAQHTTMVDDLSSRLAVALADLQMLEAENDQQRTVIAALQQDLARVERELYAAQRVNEVLATRRSQSKPSHPAAEQGELDV